MVSMPEKKQTGDKAQDPDGLISSLLSKVVCLIQWALKHCYCDNCPFSLRSAKPCLSGANPKHSALNLTGRHQLAFLGHGNRVGHRKSLKHVFLYIKRLTDLTAFYLQFSKEKQKVFGKTFSPPTFSSMFTVNNIVDIKILLENICISSASLWGCIS